MTEVIPDIFPKKVNFFSKNTFAKETKKYFEMFDPNKIWSQFRRRMVENIPKKDTKKTNEDFEMVVTNWNQLRCRMASLTFQIF